MLLDLRKLEELEQWRQDLLEQIRSEVPGICPGVIDEGVYQSLKIYLSFHHVVCNNYTTA
ncbi:MAG: hypothetical protein MJA27_19090 [Pseudanabaenales cyanobacterium]|nr:hypothetical protein [Pseudanabaenales cyanobacterium]